MESCSKPRQIGNQTIEGSGNPRSLTPRRQLTRTVEWRQYFYSNGCIKLHCRERGLWAVIIEWILTTLCGCCMVVLPCRVHA